MLSNNITRLLDQRKINYSLHSLGTDEKRTAVEVAQALGQPVEKIFKTIILSPATPGRKKIAALVPAHQEVDLKKLAAGLGEKKIVPCQLKEAEASTGMQTGGISPIGLVNKPFEIIVDESIHQLTAFIISAGIRGWQVEITPVDLLTLCKAKTLPICTSKQQDERKDDFYET